HPDDSPDGADLRLWRARGLSALGRGREAIADCSKAIEIEPADRTTWGNRGSAYYHMRRYAEAIADYTRAIDLEAGHAVLWTNRGAAHAELREWGQAAADYSKAVELDGKDAAIRNRLALIFLARGDRDA